MNKSLVWEVISKKKVKVINPRKWKLVVNTSLNEITRIPNQPFPSPAQLDEIREIIIREAKLFLQNIDARNKKEKEEN